MAEELDYYGLLGVSQDADLATIRLAFRRLARLYHPDVAGTGSLERMQQLNAAYRVLSDLTLRQSYDAHYAPLRPFTKAASSAPAAPAAPKRVGTVRTVGSALRHLRTLAAVEAMPVAALSFSAGGDCLGVGLLDGTIQLWDTRQPRMIQTLSFQSASHATNGVLQEVRLSPSGTLAMAWGFQLGTRVWNVPTGQSLWHIGAYGPSGAVDAVLFDTPAWVRLALPDAPLAISEEDPFRWAHEGRQSSSILNRPLAAAVDPAWAVPLHCYEVSQSRRFAPEQQIRVQQRMLAYDGRSLLTISTSRKASLPYSRLFRLWDLEHRTVRGVMTPRCLFQLEQPADYLLFPIAVTPDLMFACANFQGRELRLISLRTGSVQGSIAIDNLGAAAEQTQMALSPDGRFLALVSGTQLELFEAHHGQRVQQWQCAVPITALSFAPNRERLLLGVALQNGLTELWGI